MNSSFQIPVEVQPLVSAAVASGRFANEQELVSAILKVAVPSLDEFDQLRRDVQESIAMADRGEICQADFDKIRKQLCDEYTAEGKRK